METSVRPSESPSEAVKRVVAKREDCAPSDLGKLTRVVDVDRLDEVANPPIEFRYCGYGLEVKADETIVIKP